MAKSVLKRKYITIAAFWRKERRSGELWLRGRLNEYSRSFLEHLPSNARISIIANPELITDKHPDYLMVVKRVKKRKPCPQKSNGSSPPET